MLLCSMIGIKESLFNVCTNYIEARIASAQHAINNAIESSNDDTKSSAGDKYETGREMMQQEIDRNRKQLEEAKKQKLILEQIDPLQYFDVVQQGSLVKTNFGSFYIAISCGQVQLDGLIFFAISAVSPIGKKLFRQKKGYKFDFNGKTFIIEDIQ